MKKIFSLIKAGIKAIFNRETVSKVWTILFDSGKSAIGSLLADHDLMNAAFAMSWNLATNHDQNVDKTATFNAQLQEWATDRGLAIGKSAMNAIRELAYSAVKAEQERLAQ